MRSRGLAPLLSGAFYLYFLANEASRAPAFGRVGVALAAIGGVLAFLPLFAKRDALTTGQGRVFAMSVAAAFVLLAEVVPPAPITLVARLGAGAGAIVLAALALELAWAVPFRTPSRTARVFRYLSLALGFGLAAMAAWHAVFREQVGVFFLVALPLRALALVVRAGVSTRSTSAHERAANLYALSGLAVSIVLAAFATKLMVDGQGALYRAVLALDMGVLVMSHLALVDSFRRPTASALVRESFVALLALGTSAAIAPYVCAAFPPTRIGLSVAVFLLASLALVLRTPFRRVIRFVFAPERGALLGALERARSGIEGAARIEDVVRALCGPLDRAMGAVTGAQLFTFTPDHAYFVDAAGEPHAVSRELSSVVTERIHSAPRSPIFANEVRARIVRHPEDRALHAALEQLDAFAVLPLVFEGYVEGVLVLGKGARRAPATLEESTALVRVGDVLAGRLAMFSSMERAELRAQTAERKALEEQRRADVLAERAEQAVPVAEAPPREAESFIAYSESMREAIGEASRLAPLPAPLLLVGEAGTNLAALAAHVHRASGREAEPFVVARLADHPADSLAARLFGSTALGPGWLERAGNGTLVLVDVAVLSSELTSELEEALTSRRATYADSPSSYLVGARIVATSALSLATLRERGIVDAAFGERLHGFEVVHPPLRDRERDFESLVLRTLGHVSKQLGLGALGMSPHVEARLRSYAWPGNEAELELVLRAAAARARGKRIDVADLPDGHATRAELKKRRAAKGDD